MVQNRSVKISWKLSNSEAKLNSIIEEYNPKKVHRKKNFAVLLFKSIEEAVDCAESVVDRDLKAKYLGGDESLTISRINNTSLFASTLDVTKTNNKSNVESNINEESISQITSQIKSNTQPIQDNTASITTMNNNNNNNNNNVLTASTTSSIMKDNKPSKSKTKEVKIIENNSKISNSDSNIIESKAKTPKKAKHIKNIVVIEREKEQQEESESEQDIVKEIEVGDKKTILSNRIENIVNTSITTPTRKKKSKSDSGHDNIMENESNTEVLEFSHDNTNTRCNNTSNNRKPKLTHSSRIETTLPPVEEESYTKILQEEEVDDVVADDDDDEFNVLPQSDNQRNHTLNDANAESMIMMEQNTINVLPEEHDYEVSESFEEHKNMIDSAPKGSFFYQSNFHDSDEPPALSRSDLDVDVVSHNVIQVDQNAPSIDISTRAMSASKVFKGNREDLEDDMIPTRMSDRHQREIPLSFSASKSIKDRQQHSTIIRHYYDEKAKDLRKKNEVYYQENQLLLSEVNELRIRVKLLEEQRNTRDRERRDYEEEIHLMQQSWDIQEEALKKHINGLESQVRTLKVENSNLHKTKVEVWKDVAKMHDVRQQLDYDHQVSKIRRSVVDVENHVDHYNRWMKAAATHQQDEILNDIHSMASNVAMKLSKSNKVVSRLSEKYRTSSSSSSRTNRKGQRITNKEKSSRGNSSNSKHKSFKDKLAGSGPVA